MQRCLVRRQTKKNICGCALKSRIGLHPQRPKNNNNKVFNNAKKEASIFT